MNLHKFIRFLLQRLALGLSVLWGIVTLLYAIFYVLENPVSYMVGDQADEKTKQAIIQKYGLDKPVYEQYFSYINQVSPIGLSDKGTWGLKSISLGESYQYKKPVLEMISDHIGGTAILALSALFFAAIIGIPLGIWAAYRPHTWQDNSILSFSVLGVSAPSFFVAALLIWFFAVLLRPYTGLDAAGFIFEPKIFAEGNIVVWKNLFLPALALAVRPLAIFIQLTRAAMLEVLAADYIRTARAKGLSAFSILFRHSLRNALNPVITSVTGWLASLLAGTFFVEYMFYWKGIGKLTIDALNQHDFPVILGASLWVALIFVVLSLLTDLLYAVLDPRIEQ